METFNDIVTISSGLVVIFGLLATVIKPIREKITHEKERQEENRKQFSVLQKGIKNVHEEVADVADKVYDLDEKVDRNEAERARTQILRFADEIYLGQLHSKEHFDEVRDSIDKYNQFCDQHPKFKNSRTVAAQQRIEEVYQQCMEEHSFLK